MHINCTRILFVMLLQSKSPPLLYAPAEVHPPVCLAASCARNIKALKKIFSAPSAQKVKIFLRASREKEISFLEGGESLEVLVIFKVFFEGLFPQGFFPGFFFLTKRTWATFSEISSFFNPFSFQLCRTLKLHAFLGEKLEHQNVIAETFSAKHFCRNMFVETFALKGFGRGHLRLGIYDHGHFVYNPRQN